MVWRSWGAGSPLLLLHGGHGSWMHWKRNVGALVAHGREVWAPDLPGFGESALPPSGNVITPAFMLGPLREGLGALLGGRSCEVAAFSFGAMVGGLLAQAEPERVRALVVVGAAGLAFVPPVRPELFNWKTAEEGEARRAVHAANLRAQMLARDGSCDAAAVEIQHHNTAHYRLRGARDPGSRILSDALARCSVPVAAVWGEKDAMVGGRLDVAEQAIACASGYRGTWWIPEAGHWVMYDAPVEFDGALRAALDACR